MISDKTIWYVTWAGYSNQSLSIIPITWDSSDSHRLLNNNKQQLLINWVKEQWTRAKMSVQDTIMDILLQVCKSSAQLNKLNNIESNLKAIKVTDENSTKIQALQESIEALKDTIKKSDEKLNARIDQACDYFQKRSFSIIRVGPFVRLRQIDFSSI